MNINKVQKLKISALMVTITGLMLLTGCSSFPVNPEQQQSSVVNSKPVKQPISTDVIHHIGYPAHNGVRQKGSVLVGDKYSYLISTGSEQLNLLTELQPQKLQIQQPIEIYRYPDNSVHLQLRFNYSSTEGLYSNEERKLLSQICKATNDQAMTDTSTTTSATSRAINSYSCKLTLQGGIYAALQQVASNSKVDLGLRAEIYPTTVIRTKTQAEIGVIPLNVILETIELPLELLSIIK